MVFSFVKMSGAGNDFVVIDRTEDGGLQGLPAMPALVRKMTDRRSGIGADGVIVLGPATAADFTMHYFNADGSSGSLCGNGGRCAASLLMDRWGRGEVRFITSGKVYRAKRVDSGILLEMENPGPVRPDLTLRAGANTWKGHFIDTGSPHLVIMTDGGLPERDVVLMAGRELRNHAEFRPSGTNVDFVSVEGEGRLKIRTYERGVEDETWACGTGAVASAIIYALLRGPEGENVISVVPLSSEVLTVRFFRRGSRFSGVSLEGPAAVTFTGIFDSERR